MIDLHFLVQKVKSTSHEVEASTTRSKAFRSAANVIIGGLIYTNSWAGRPGEWEALERITVATNHDSVVVMLVLVLVVVAFVRVAVFV